MDEFEFQSDPILTTELAALEYLKTTLQVANAIFIQIVLILADN